MALSAAEQYLLELINRARLDPAGEAARQGVSLNADLKPGTISAASKQVLASSSELDMAAVRHSKWMLANDTFSHTGTGGSDPGQRMKAAGYDFVGASSWRENLAWSGSTGPINLSRAIEGHYDGLYRSSGHRKNTFASEIREIGIAQEKGVYTYAGRDYQASMLTEKFALSGSGKFVTGVAYDDRNGNNFYSIGEGKSGYWVREQGGKTDTTAGAGGYTLDVGGSGTTTVAVGKGKARLAVVELDMSDGNAKLDIISAGPSVILGFSVSADLVSGPGRAKLLGAADLDLTGTGGHDALFGNSGENDLRGGAGRDVLRGAGGEDRLFGGHDNDRLFGNASSDRLLGDRGDDRLDGGKGHDVMYGGTGADRMKGGAGNDVFWGGSSHDRMKGGTGNDRMYGGEGNDRMHGGLGADTFVFTGGRDRIQDFTDDQDTIIIHRSIDGVGSISKQDLLDSATVSGGTATFQLSANDRLIINGVDDINDLANDLLLV